MTMTANESSKNGIESRLRRTTFFVLATLCVSVSLLSSVCSAQQMTERAALENKQLLANLTYEAHSPDDIAPMPATEPAPLENKQLLVSWAYGAYVPKDVALTPMTLGNRLRLFQSQSFTSPGIYIKSSFLGLVGQAKGDPKQWGGGMEGYGRRLSSNYSQSLVQNSLSTTGNALLQYEPRYNRCRCSGLWPRTRHAFLRNFLTYNKTEQELRPQFALYGAAFASGMISSAWKPRTEIWEQGARGMLTQAEFGLISNWIGEFSPEISRVLHGKHLHVPEN
jgi:hypothetical protein